MACVSVVYHCILYILKVGACIVNDSGKIVGIGYNGFPLRISDDDPNMSWGKGGNDPMKVKYPYGKLLSIYDNIIII